MMLKYMLNCFFVLKTDTSPDSEFFSFGVVERLARQEKILKLLASGSIDEEDPLVDLSMLYNLMAPQSSIADLPPRPFVPSFGQNFNDVQTLQTLVYPTKELYLKESFLELVGDRSNYPEIYHHPDNTGTEMNDILSAISEFHSLKNTNKSCRQTLLVPFFERYCLCVFLNYFGGGGGKFHLHSCLTFDNLKGSSKFCCYQLHLVLSF